MIGNLITSLAVAPAAVVPVSGYSLWLDAADASVFTYSSGTVVSQWSDKSGNAYNFTQATVANQPSRNATQNGLSALTFDVDALANTSLNWGASNSTLFIVAKEDKALGTGFQNVFTTGTGATGEWGYGIFSDSDPNSDKIGIFDIGQAASAFTSTMTNGNADVLAFTTAGVVAGTVIGNLFKNGTADASNPVSRINTTSASGARLGAAAVMVEPFYGVVCEIILYPSQLGTSDRNLVEDYLETKWGTP